MRRSCWCAWFLIAVGSLSPPAFAAGLQPGYLLDHWGTADGLPMNAISAVVVGRDGYVWLATYGGLARFDGNRFTTFDGASGGLSNDRLISLAADPDGLLWALNETHNLLSFDGHRFRVWGEADGLPSTTLELPPLVKGGALWAGTAQGPMVFDPAARRWRLVARTAAVNAIDSLDDGSVWIGTVDGLLRFDNGSLSSPPKKVQGLPDPMVVALMHEPRDGAMWVATAAGVVRLDGERIEHVTEQADVLRIETDDDGSVVLVSPLVDRIWRDGRIRVVPSPRGEPQQADSGPLAARDGGIWRSHRGVIRRNGEVVLDHPCAVRSMAADASGGIWFASQCGGLQRVRAGAISGLTNIAGQPLGPVYGLAQTPDGSLWMAPIDGTVAVRHADGTEKRLGAAEGFGDIVVASFLAEADGTLWAARTHLCIVRNSACSLPPGLPPALDPGSGLLGSSPSGGISGVHRDRSGTLWVSARNGLWSERGGRWEVALENNWLRRVRAFAETGDGSVWFGTNGDGVYRRSPDGRWTRHGPEQGLSSLRRPRDPARRSA